MGLAGNRRTGRCDVRSRPSQSRMTGSMDLKRPSRLLGLANEPTRLPIRRWPLAKVDRLRIDSAEAKGRRHAPMAAADRGVGGETAVRPGERFDRARACCRRLRKRSPKRGDSNRPE